MPLSISDHFRIPPDRYEETGALDAFLDIDTRLFIDPHLLCNSTAEEISQSYEVVLRQFGSILKVLSKNRLEGDAFWRAAERLLDFREVKGLCIGYSTRGTSGSGMGRGFREILLRTAKEIVNAGIQDPEIFELVGLFEDGIGADRVSDMIANIILPNIAAYSERIFAELDIEAEQVNIRAKSYRIPINPRNQAPLLLVPRDVLRDLPIARDYDDIDRVVSENRELRERLNASVGGVWRSKTAAKRSLRYILLQNPEVLRRLLLSYKAKAAEPYDYERDPQGEFVWYRAAKLATSQFALALVLPDNPSAEDIHRLVREICEHFKKLIENHGLHTVLYNEDGSTRREETAQKLFFAVGDGYCAANNIDITRESNGGRGPVDFKFSRGYQARVIVEAKLSSNNRAVHGYEVQIGEYERAERTDHSIMLVIDVDNGTKARLDALVAAREKAVKSGGRAPELFFVDGKSKASASKYKPKD